MNTIQIEGLDGNQLQAMFNSLGQKIDGLRSDIKDLGQNSKAEGNPPKYLTTKEACDFLKVSSMTLRRWSHAGILKPKRAGNKVYYSYADIQAALKDKAV